MTTPAKLYGKDLSEYDEVDVDELLAQLSPEEIKILAKEVDPDVSLMPGPLFYFVDSLAQLILLVSSRIIFCHQTRGAIMSAKKSPRGHLIARSSLNISTNRPWKHRMYRNWSPMSRGQFVAKR